MSPDWSVQTIETSVAEAHARRVPVPARREIWFFEPTDRAIVLGSTQRLSTLDLAEVSRRGLEVVRRRSGGGAVLVEPGTATWFDVILPAGDPYWSDDVSAASRWLGQRCAEALRSLGIDAGAPARCVTRSRWASLVCFAGLGMGEVQVDGAKVVGISQRRTRTEARFQVTVLHAWSPEDLVPLLALTPGEQVELMGELEHAAVGVTCATSSFRTALVSAVSGGP